MKSPIKYYGGKSYMTKIILSHFPKEYDIYVEGFGGGASVLFEKAQEGIEVYNDLGENVYSLFKVLSDKDKFDELKHRLDLTPYSHQLRDEYKELLKGKLSLEDRAYYFIYVNKSSFNGVGGFSTTMLVRRNMSKSCSDYLSMIDKLPNIHNRLSSVIIEHRDIMELLKKYDGEKTFFYLDPPYVKSTRSSSTTYEVEMSDDRHREMLDFLLACKSKVLISGYNHPIYDCLNGKFERVDFQSPNSCSDRLESLWKNY
jgi:DNA adenine methylase